MAAAPAPAFRVAHTPARPRSGEAVEVTVRAAKTVWAEQTPRLLYQVVEPGRYLELSSAAYTNEWVSLPFQAVASTEESQTGEEMVFKAKLPASLQKHRRLLRYRVQLGNSIVAPDASDTQPNFASCVDDRLPAWRGAVEPRSSEPTRRTAVTYGPELMRSVQVYHFIADQRAVENTTWDEPTEVRDDVARHQYRHTGTMVVDGHVYDHVRFRARGGEWRHAMGKNMW